MIRVWPEHFQENPALCFEFINLYCKKQGIYWQRLFEPTTPFQITKQFWQSDEGRYLFDFCKIIDGEAENNTRIVPVYSRYYSFISGLLLMKMLIQTAFICIWFKEINLGKITDLSLHSRSCQSFLFRCDEIAPILVTPGYRLWAEVQVY